MSQLKQLTPGDVLFIGGETNTVYQHGAGLILLDTSGVRNYGFDTFRQHMETHVGRIPQLRWKLHEVPLGLDLPYWVEDEKFNLDNHIRRVAVPPPGDDRALADLVSYLYCRHLDRSRPPWEFWFIEGLAGGRCAFLQKMHHCMSDGEGAVRLIDMLWDHRPDGPSREVDPALAGARAGAVPSLWQQTFNSASHLAHMPLAAGRDILELARQSVGRRLAGSGEHEGKPAAPPTSFNHDIGADRALAFGRLPLAQVKAVKNAFGVTVNDVVLALVSCSVRDYLSGRGELPADSLRTSIAVSLRSEEDASFSNQVTATSVTLATDLDDPLERLQAIAVDSHRAKERAHHGGKGFLEFMQLFPPLLVNGLTRATPAERVPGISGVNLVVSNIRGSDNAMYIGGARAEAVYPMSIIIRGGGLNVTCLTYAGNVHFGVTVEPNLIPDPWPLAEGLERALAQYSGLLPAHRRPRKKASSRRGGRAR